MKAMPDLTIDYLVLNAGILKYPNVRGPLNHLPEAYADKDLQKATEICTLLALPPICPPLLTRPAFLDFALHLSTNTIGPIIIAQKLLKFSPPVIKNIVFISSDSGSATKFRDFEDGFGAYAASKAALNQMLRHMAAELKRQGSDICVLAMHPGEVTTDMAANVEVEWEVEGIISVEESVSKMLPVIESKLPKDTGTFWTWDGREHPW